MSGIFIEEKQVPSNLQSMEVIIISVSLGMSYEFKARKRIAKATHAYMGIIIAPPIPKILIRTRAADRVNNPYIAVS
jgi:hypothetical protein